MRRNTIKNVEVQAGLTGISNPDETIFVRRATPHGLTMASNAAREDKEPLQMASMSRNNKP
jgi:hypothetical protein